MRLAAEAGLQVSQLIRRNGKGYLQSRFRNFCQMASFQTVLVLADLDRARSPSELLADWFGTREAPSGLVVRFAVREVEAWILADHQAMRELVGSRAGRFPDDPESLLDPKQTLLNLARRAPRQVRDDLLPARGAVASQGLGFNSRMSEVIQRSWDPARASKQSPSLQRARNRLREVAERLL